MAEEKKKNDKDKVRTGDIGGDAYIGDRVNTGGGDFVGRDMVTGDKVMGDKVSGDKISVGDVSGSGIAIGRGASASVTTGDTYSGDFRGAITSVHSTLSNVSQSIGSIPKADDQDKADLEQLVASLDKVLQEMVRHKPERGDDAEAVAELTKRLVDTASAENPNKTMLQITAEGLKSAAKNVAEMMPEVLDIVSKIIPIVAAFAK